MVPTGQQTDAVGTYQCTAVLLAGVEYTLLQQGALVGLLAEAGRYNNERTNLFLCCKNLNVVRAILSCNHKYGQVSGWQFLHIVESFDALHLILLGIQDAQRTVVATIQEIAHHSATWLMFVVGAADDDDALRL